MSWLKRLFSSLRANKHEEDLDNELRFHLAMREKDNLSHGYPVEDARRRAMERFGSVTRMKDACREQSTLPWIDAAMQDFLYAARNMRKNLRFSFAATACLAIGIGANTSVFSFVNAFLFQPLPADVVLVRRASGGPVSYPEYRDWKGRNPVFREMFGYSPGERLAIGRDESDHALGETVVGQYYQGLGVVPAMGRFLTPEDESQPLAVLGHEFWKRKMQGDGAVIGKTIWIDRAAFTIVGVAPATFQGMLAPWSTDVWITPYLRRERLEDRRVEWMLVAANLRPGVTVKQAEAAMKSLDLRLRSESVVEGNEPASRRDPVIVVRNSGLSGSPVWNVFVAMAALLTILAGIIFVIACANVAGLLVARGLTRRREILIRLSLGATRGRVIRQLLTESCLLGLLGAFTGAGIAMAAGDTLAGLLPQSISGGFRFQHGMDGNVLAFVLALALISVVISGLMPAFRVSGMDLSSAGRTQSASGSRTPRLRQWLVVGQVAASVLVLATAGVFVRTFQQARRADPGFAVPGLLSVDLSQRRQGNSGVPMAETLSRLRGRVRELPGVVSASVANVFPFGNTRVSPVTGLGATASAMVDSDYFRAMGIPLLRGREPQPSDRNVVVVNEALANRLWPGEDPIGKVIRLDKSVAPYDVVGLTATGKYWSLSEPARPFLYLHSEALAESRVNLVIRVHGASGTIAGQVEEEIRRLPQDIYAGPVQTGSERLHQWVQPQRSAAVLLGLLGVTALLLAITGLYALLAQIVAHRTAEIAVRVTLGASRRAVGWMLLRHSARLIVAGTALGIGAAYSLARVLGAIMGEVSPLDGITMMGVVSLLAVVGAVATLAPAYRAMRVDPVSALRTE